MFSSQEKDQMSQILSNRLTTDEGKQDLRSTFERNCLNNLHIIVCFSYIGDYLRICCRNYPSIINNTTIDWFTLWPNSALEALASKFLKDIEMTNDVR